MKNSPIRDQSERFVAEYLIRKGFIPLHHPEGEHNPPDFAIDGQIAVEVRRLNQHWHDGERNRGVEERETSLFSIVEEVLVEFGPPIAGRSYWVSCSFQNSLPSAKSIKSALRNAIRQHLHEPIIPDLFVENVELRFYKVAPRPSLFSLGIQSNSDRGGFVAAEMIKNLDICIAEKTKKILRVLGRYAEWWLTFVDHISYGEWDKAEIEAIRSNVKVPVPWTKILIISADARQALEL